MEAGNSSAGNGDEQDREHVSQLFIMEAGVHGQVHGRMGHEKPQHGSGDHADEHIGGHDVTGLL